MMFMPDPKSLQVMVVDDTPANLRLLTSMLESQGYKVAVFPRGRLALTAAIEDPPDVVLLDINMPEMNGYEVCERFKSIDKLADIPIIFVSAKTETIDKLRAFSCGAVDYVTKPFQFEEVKARVQTHVELRCARLGLKRHNENLQRLVEEQVRDILANKEEISEAQLATILAMSKIADAKDDDTGKHIERTQRYCRVLADRLRQSGGAAGQIDDVFVNNLYHASPLHDIGKVSVPDNILKKPGKLTDEEFEVMKSHTAVGAEKLETVLARYSNNAFIKMGAEIARSHHEKWSGKGYPDGLEGDNIPLSAQIMAVADVYDALRSERCYKPAFTHEQSRDIILADSGTHFAPSVVRAFQEVENEFAEINEWLRNT